MEGSAAPPPLLTTLATKTLVEQATGGSEEAVRILCERFRPRLVAWARGRLPDYARDLLETEDLVQETLVTLLRRVHGFQDRGPGSFLQYLKTSILNRVRTEIRRVKRRGMRSEVDDGILDRDPTPIEQYLSKETEQHYNEALATLSPDEQELVIARVELQMTAHEIAIHTGRPSTDAARMAARRAILKLAKAMRAGGQGP